MKKLLAFLLALSLLLALAACGEGETPAAETEAPAAETPVEEDGVPPDPEEDDEPDDPSAEPDDPGEIYEEPEEELTGLWYCSFGETNLCLELEEGGAYTVTLPNDPEATVTGLWEEQEGFLYLDGDETAPLVVYGNGLSWPAAGVFLSREEPAPLYVPAETLENLPARILDGYWVAAFLELDGELFSVEALDEFMDLYVEGSRAALGGPLFGDQIVDLDVGEDALHFEGEGFGVDMRLQRDGFMRLRIEAEGAGELVYYLYNATPVDDAELDGD